MVVYSLKVFVLFTSAIVGLHLMGKSARLKVTPHDLVAIVMIAALATNPILVKNDIKKTLLAIILIALIHLIYAKLTLYRRTNQWLIGEPTILVKHGKIVKESLRRCEISLAELLSHIRAKGYPDIREIQYGILEPTGELTVLPREELYPVTPKDLQLETEYRGVALSLIVDGRIQHHNLRLIGKDVSWLKDQLRRKGWSDTEKVLYAAKMNDQTDIFIDNGEGSR
ncbi:DUF421 domain-containing protein [Salinithrix halophila]|uniref:DUF421 domain-containing protein n=1 Tax=Salinithrix halophila TaxID=1485204 RepID=A0ABV8JHW3_9BACL